MVEGEVVGVGVGGVEVGGEVRNVGVGVCKSVNRMGNLEFFARAARQA